MIKRNRFALLGHPVRHSVSPTIHAAAYFALRLPHVYTAIDVPNQGALARVVSDLRTGALGGANVTTPYKRSVLDLVDVRGPSIEEVGAANVLCRDANGRVVAHNTDVDALVAELEEAWTGRPRHRAVVIGAGGAGLAAMVACKRLGFKVIGATTRSWSSSEFVYESQAGEIARKLGVLTSLWPRANEAMPSGKASGVLRMQWRELAIQADCVIQATSAGMLGADPGDEVADIVPWDRLPSHALAVDVVYNPRTTPFLRAARARGLRGVDGVGMLVRQAALSFALWTGREAPIDVMRNAADEALDRSGSSV